MKPSNKNEERLTAFALGEMHGPEKELFEKDMDANIGIQNEVSDIKNFTSELRQDLSREGLPGRDLRLHKNLMQVTGGEGQGGKSIPKKTAFWSFGLIAAASVIAAIVLPRYLDRGPSIQLLEQKDVSDARSKDLSEHESEAMDELAGPAQVQAEKVKKFASQPMMHERAGGTAKTDRSHALSNGSNALNGKSEFNTEAYDRIVENSFKSPVSDALSTFSVDVDTASYANIRRFVSENELPPKDSVRIEEMVNYFPYLYKTPEGNQPFAVDVEVAQAPWKEDHRLVKIGIKAKDVVWGQTPPSNLVFLIDISGSMNDSNKLPLLKKALKMLVERLGENDRVAVVVYAGASGLVLSSTSASQKQKILDVLEQLSAGGSTNGGEGIELAYSVALENYIKAGINRVIVATDGDFNMGVTSQGQLIRLIEEKAKSGVFLSVLGFGMGNFKDATLEKLASVGNGNYAYIDNENEARKVLVEQIGGTMMTVAKDVKIQVEFNPAKVESYRLIGYENRMLANQDFNNDTKDAGDIGAGHTVTAFYEVVPKGSKSRAGSVDPLKYQKPAPVMNDSEELLNVKLRFKKPDEEKSSLIEFGLHDQGQSFANASEDFRFAAAVVGVGMVLRDSAYKGSATLGSMLDVANGARGSDPSGYRKEFTDLVRKLGSLSK